MGCCIHTNRLIPEANIVGKMSGQSKGSTGDEPKPGLPAASYNIGDSSSSSTGSHWEVNFLQERCPVTINRALTEAYGQGGKKLSKAFKKECSVLRKEFMVHSRHSQGSVDPEFFSKARSTQVIRDEIIRSAVDKWINSSMRHAIWIPLEYGVRVCCSFQQYHTHRDNLFEPYEVILQKHDPNWKLYANKIKAMLKLMNCHVQ